MRTLKFKAWHEGRQEMYDVYGFNDDFQFKKGYDTFDPDPRSEVKLLQFTGLHDTTRTEEFPNGREIYVDFIINDGLSTGRVIYFHPYASFMIELDNGHVYGLDDSLHRGGKLIGNIHENPELLK